MRRHSITDLVYGMIVTPFPYSFTPGSKPTFPRIRPTIMLVAPGPRLTSHIITLDRPYHAHSRGPRLTSHIITLDRPYHAHSSLTVLLSVHVSSISCSVDPSVFD